MKNKVKMKVTVLIKYKTILYFKLYKKSFFKKNFELNMLNHVNAS